MTTPPKKKTLQAAQVLGLLSAVAFGPEPHLSAILALLGLVLLVLGCSLKGL